MRELGAVGPVTGYGVFGCLLDYVNIQEKKSINYEDK